MLSILLSTYLAVIPVNNLEAPIANSFKITCPDIPGIIDAAVGQIAMQTTQMQANPTMTLSEAVIRLTFIASLQDVIRGADKFKKENCAEG